MVLANKTVRLLILGDSQNEAERLISLFRNAGRATRAHRITSADDLDQALQGVWDLLICAPASANLDPGAAIAAIRRQARDIPVIQLTESSDATAITAALALGAQDALPQTEDEHLLLVAARELANLEERRARRAAELALHEAEKRCQLLLESSVDAIAYVHDGMHIYANRAYLELFGYVDADELEGMPMVDLVAKQDQAELKAFLKRYQRLQGNADMACSGVRADGGSFKTHMHLSPAAYDGESCIQIVIRAESGNRDLEEKLRELSSRDPVTGLFNRSHFLERMDTAVKRSIGGGQAACLAYIRVDHFASLLVDIGLADADLLLAELAELLRGHFAEGTQLARFGDDVFTALLANSATGAEAQLGRLLGKVEGHLFDIAGRTVQITLTIGVAGLDEKTAKAQDVIDRAHRCADELADGNALKIYDPAGELAAAANRGDVVAMLQQALEQDSFRLLFQPIISLRGDRHEHYEVLLRLVNAQGEEVPPPDFLDDARESGLATKIDRWVVPKAIKLLAAHRAKGHDTRLFVHLSSASLQDPNLLPWLETMLKAAKLPADALVFQLTEADAITYLKRARTLTQGLAKLHCKIALDQFGCALNPLNTLRYLQVDFVKLDGSYGQDLSLAEHQETLKSLLADLHEQGKSTIMPCVESASVLATLWQAGVTYIQGDYLQGPSQTMDYDFSPSTDLDG